MEEISHKTTTDFTLTSFLRRSLNVWIPGKTMRIVGWDGTVASVWSLSVKSHFWLMNETSVSIKQPTATPGLRRKR